MKKIIFIVFCMAVFRQNILCMYSDDFYTAERSNNIQLQELFKQENELIIEASEAEKDKDPGYIRANYQGLYTRLLLDVLKNIYEIYYTQFGVSPPSDEDLVKEVKRKLNYI
ncbi:MAG: hypothetical protein IJ730_02730 [Alphaproteobacteria bacterium]|nr:hypothetical protein [Alphaproteobacteria bacterium]